MSSTVCESNKLLLQNLLEQENLYLPQEIFDSRIDLILTELDNLNMIDSLKNSKIPAKDIRQLLFNHEPYGEIERKWRLPKKFENTHLNKLITYIWATKCYDLFNILYKFNSNIMIYGLEKASYNYLIRYYAKISENKNIENELTEYITDKLKLKIINKHKAINSETYITLEYEVQVNNFICENVINLT